MYYKVYWVQYAFLIGQTNTPFFSFSSKASSFSLWFTMHLSFRNRVPWLPTLCKKKKKKALSFVDLHRPADWTVALLGGQHELCVHLDGTRWSPKSSRSTVQQPCLRDRNVHGPWEGRRGRRGGERQGTRSICWGGAGLAPQRLRHWAISELNTAHSPSLNWLICLGGALCSQTAADWRCSSTAPPSTGFTDRGFAGLCQTICVSPQQCEVFIKAFQLRLSTRLS